MDSINGLYGHTNGFSSDMVNGFDETSGINSHKSPEIALDVPVLVVGGGPTGLLQAYLLSQLGVRSLIVEQYLERLGAPKAHALSPRSLEICRQFGLNVKHIRSLGSSRSDAYWVNFLTNLSGEAVGRLPYERMDPAVLEATPEMIHNISQPAFEQFVTDALGIDSKVQMRKGVVFVSLSTTEDEVITTVEERATKHRYSIRSRHVIACDGAKSKVRTFMNIESDGEDSYETMMTIHFNADLRPIVGNRVGMLHWIMDPVAAGFIIGYDLSNNQVLISNFDAKKHPVKTWSEDLCRKVVTAAIGKTVPFDVLSYRPWILSRKVAKQYSHGNVFLSGDAAHSFPPTGGLGLNSGLADVHNLAYKIAAVQSGWGAPSLLKTYQSERQPVANVNSLQSVKNGKKIFGLLKALGTTASDIPTARANLYAAIRKPERLKVIDAEIEAQREHFDNLELHIGYVYGSTEIPSNASSYAPKYIPGARLPHAWMRFCERSHVQHPPPVDVSYVTEFSDSDIQARQYSTLDLCAPDAFTLIVDGASASNIERWEAPTEQLKAYAWQKGIPINFRYSGIDFELLPGAQGDAWAKGFGLEGGRGILVRPDQHVLMVLGKDSAFQEIRQGLEAHLGV